MKSRPALRALVLTGAMVAGSALPAVALLPVRADAAPTASDARTGTLDRTGYRLRIEGFSDSLRLAIGLPARDDSGRVWSGADLETAALQARDLLARRGALEGTVRLVLAQGQGPRPGWALLQLARDGSPAPLAPILHAPVDLERALADSAAASFTAASRGAISIDAVAAGLSAARDVLIESGYYAAEVGLDSLSMAEGAPRAHLRAVPGPRTVVESIELAGAVSTRPGSAGAIAGLKPGTRVTPAVLLEARERLRGSGLFDAVGDPRVAPGTVPGGARVVIPVEERRASRFEGALGLAREGGLTGLVDLALGNIGGSGRAAGLRWFGPGSGRSEYAARYREPALFGGSIDATAALDAQVVDSLVTQTRWSLAFGRRFRGGTRGSLTVERSGSVYSGLARGSSASWSAGGSFDHDRLRPALNPEGGFRVALGAEGGRRIERYPFAPASSRGVFRGTVRAEVVERIASNRVLYAALRAQGSVLPGSAYPAEELRFLGGNEGLRGHRDRAFGGSRIAAATIEHRWITDARGGRLYLFADAARHDLDAPIGAGGALLPASGGSGATASLARTVLTPGWEVGYGAGLKARVASGLVGLELGFAPGEPLRSAALHVRYASTW